MSTAFTRQRKLPFKSVLELLLRKSVKSLQIVLNEWSEDLDYKVTASALSQARQKFSHTAFIELLDRCVVDSMYHDDDFDTYRGHRLLAIDGSTLRLPTTQETSEKFGIVRYMNSSERGVKPQVEGKMTVLYDVLNRIPIEAHLFPGRTHDLKASEPLVSRLSENDIVLADRAFCSYKFFTEIQGQNADFIIRCKSNSFSSYHNLFEKGSPKEVIIEVHKPGSARNYAALPATLKIRLVRVVLGDGEIEVLATSLLDKRKFPRKHFKTLYRKRWGVETYFQVLKSRLCIDNFTGKTVDAIMQDFHSTMFVSGLETIITEEANQELAKKDTKYKQQVNKAISFHAIKNKIIAMMIHKPKDFGDLQKQILELFLVNPTLAREREKPKRYIDSDTQNRNSLYFQRYAKKHVY